MKATSHSPLGPAAVTSPELAYGTRRSGTPRSFAIALARSTVTPRGSPLAGSRVAQNAEGTGPTPMPTRSVPPGATSAAGGVAGDAASRTLNNPATNFIAASYTRRFAPDRIPETAAFAAVFIGRKRHEPRH